MNGDPEALAGIAEQLTQLVAEVRRQGRASVAAQAAAEACQEAVVALTDRLATPAAPDGGPTTWLHALLPVFDALERTSHQAAGACDRSRRWRMPWQRDATRELAALAEGLRVLREQLRAALEQLDVRADEEVGVEVDAERHRVVELEARQTAVATVVEVLRPGYWLGERRIRETEVRATRASSTPERKPAW